MNNASDPLLYANISEEIKNKYPINSAYRSGLIVKEYKRRFKDIYGNINPYIGKNNKYNPLTRWFNEEWKNQRGEEGYQQKGDLYRPTKRITDDTPTTWSELTKSEINRAKKEKITKGRVSKFSKGGDLTSKEIYLSQFIPIQKKIAKDMEMNFIEDIVVSPIKKKKYRVILKDGEYVDYGYYGMLENGKMSEDYLEHGDDDRRAKFHQRWKNNPNKDNIYSPVFWILRLTW